MKLQKRIKLFHDYMKQAILKFIIYILQPGKTLSQH